MRLSKRVEDLEGRVGPAERVDTIILRGVAPATEPGGQPVVVSETVLWTLAEGGAE